MLYNDFIIQLLKLNIAMPNIFIENINIKKIKNLDSVKMYRLIHKLTERSFTKNLIYNCTSSQLVLIFYYSFKYLGIEPRVNINISSAAKLAHLILNKEFSSINNSDIYKKFQQAPHLKNSKELTKDLEVIKPLFQKAQLNGIVKILDKEMAKLKLA